MRSQRNRSRRGTVPNGTRAHCTGSQHKDLPIGGRPTLTDRYRSQLAVTSIAIACSLWGANFLFSKLALAELPVSHVVLLRFTLASLALVPAVIVHRVWPQLQDLPLFILTGFLTVPVNYLLLYQGLALTSATSAALLSGGLPVLFALAAAWFFHERLSTLEWLAVGASTLGVALIVGPLSSSHYWLGDALVLVSLFATVAWVMLSKRLLARYSAQVATAYIFMFGTLALLPISLLWDGPLQLSLSSGVWASVLALGLICTALPYALWNWGLQYVTMSHAGIYQNLESLVGVLLAVTVLHESVGPGALLGGLLIVTAAVIVLLGQGRGAP